MFQGEMIMPNRPNQNRDEAIERLAQYLNLTPDAIAVAEGWSILPEGPQRHVKLLIDDYIASRNPVLQTIYANATHTDQLRFNSIIEAAQEKWRDDK